MNVNEHALVKVS